ncbi:MAG: PBP1A family penicillin-binding protein [Gemmatimonadales bacterium]|nr:PBP1A family penicillin-binding protein [Gemmatimonadales bacterium]
MSWQEIRTRLGAGLTWTRARINGRLLVGVAFATLVIGTTVIAVEAAIRARLEAPATRLPSGLYSRPHAWRGSGGRPSPTLIAPAPGAPDEIRLPVDLDVLPRHLVDAVLAIEDQRFYDHHGLDPRRIGGALVANLKAGGIAQGGSTITQQLAKNLFLSAERTPLRKAREAAMAIALELRYDKATILEAYLNEIYLGQDRGRAMHGVGAAARYYFGKDARKISLAESALLAAMIHAPNRLAPTRNAELARRRRNLVLGLMVEQDRIGSERAAAARRSKVATRAYPATRLDARHFRDHAVRGLPGRVSSRGVAIYTTLDAELQRAAVGAVKDGLARHRAPDAQAALIAIDPRSGDILAMVGGRDYGTSQFNRAVDARRQPGSTFKPIVALAALRRAGASQPAFTLASRIDDEPIRVTTGSESWEPANYDGNFRGAVTMRQALEQSLNIPFVRIGLAVGPERIAATARQLGITSPLVPVPSLALGSSEISLLELTRAYGVFATGGQLASSRILLGAARQRGEYPDGGPPDVSTVVAPAEAYLITSALTGAVERGTSRALGTPERQGRMAGKTGTSNDWRDAWFVAYSPTLVVGVWMGYDDGRSLKLTGADAALPIVARFLERANPAPGRFQVPDGIEVARIADGWSWHCTGEEVFLEGTAPAGRCVDEPMPLPEWNPDRGEWRDRVRGRTGRLVAQLLERLIERQLDNRRGAGH